MNKVSGKKENLIIAVVAFTIFSLAGLLNPNTNDSGDSLMHYFYSHYSWQHPAFFLHHWGKPLFILLSSPFSQFGFAGIKIFQALCWTLALIFTLKIFKDNDNRLKWFVVIAFLFAPKVILSVSSGLTEPLFASLLGAVVYFSFAGKNSTAALLCSFLPFARSEGMIIAMVFLFFLLLKKDWKTLPLLAAGNIIYGIAGGIYYHDLLWYYNQNPYNVQVEKYGSGHWWHFIEQLQYITGVPLYVLFFAGIAAFIFSVAKREKISSHQFIVIYGFTIAFITAHSYFWWKGIYGSFGLKRVLLCVFPCIALIGIYGFLFLENAILKIALFLKKNADTQLSKNIFSACIIFYWVVFPFTPNPAAFHKKEFSKPADQVMTDRAIAWAKENYPNSEIRVSTPYSAFVIKKNPFDDKGIFIGHCSPGSYPAGSIYLWESWFSPFESGISQQTLTENGFEKLNCFETNNNGQHGLICLFLKAEETK